MAANPTFAMTLLPAAQRLLPGSVDILASVPRWRPLTRAETERFPNRAIASIRLHITGAAGTTVFFAGTGWFITPTRVVTAAHVTDVRDAWSRVSGARSWHLEIVPALSPNGRPFKQAWALRVLRHPNWNGVSVTPFDAAVLEVQSELDPQSCLEMQVFPFQSGARPVVEVSGYPFAGFGGDTQVMGQGPIGVVEGSMLFYDIDTEDGQSGAPILMSSPGARPVVAGMHLAGQGVGSSSLARSLNAGLALRPEVLEWIRTAGH